VGEGQLLMTQAERDRLVALKKAKKKLMTQKQAAEGITERQVRRLLRKLRQKGDQAVIHELRGRESNRKLSSEVEQQAITILSDPGVPGIFGPTLGKRGRSDGRENSIQFKVLGSGSGYF
jgi:hypothetical protein